MSAIEDLFEKFEKGELRLAEQEVTGIDPDSSGQVVVSVEDLVSIESVLGVLVDDGSGNYTSFVSGNTSGGSLGAEGTLEDSTDDNQVTVTLYKGQNTAEPVTHADGDSPNNIKVVARGY